MLRPTPTCLVCARAASRYACPACNAPYCSAPCYAAHGLRCTEAFFRSQVAAELRLRGAEDAAAGGEARKVALAAVARERGGEGGGGGAIAGLVPHQDSGDDDEGDGEDKGQGYVPGDGDAGHGDPEGREERAAAVLARFEFLASVATGAGGAEAAASLLTREERLRLSRAAARGRLDPSLGRALRAWTPWWSQPLVHHRLAVASASATAAMSTSIQAQELGETRQDGGSGDALPAPPPCILLRAASDTSSAPTVTSTTLLPLSALLGAGRAPSPLLRFSVVDVLLAYCHTLRLFCGEWRASPAEAAAVLCATSPALAEDARHASAACACVAVIEASHAPAVRRTANADPRTALLLLRDCAELMREPHYVVDALADALDIAAAAELAALPAAPVRSARTLQAAARKLRFLACWGLEAFVKADEGRSDFDRIAAGAERGADLCAALREGVCAFLAAQVEGMRAAETVERLPRG